MHFQEAERVNGQFLIFVLNCIKFLDADRCTILHINGFAFINCPLQFSPQVSYWIEVLRLREPFFGSHKISVWILRYVLGHCHACESTYSHVSVMYVRGTRQNRKYLCKQEIRSQVVRFAQYRITRQKSLSLSLPLFVTRN